MEDSKSFLVENPEAILADDSTRFDKSLQELKDLCSQLNYAADYCEASFLNAEHAQKKMVIKTTKEYLCRAVVTVVDHLGNVSANLYQKLPKENSVSEAEFRINSLKQVQTSADSHNARLITSQKYSHKLSFPRLPWSANFPRYHPRYIFPPMPDHKRSQEVSRKSVNLVAAKSVSDHEFETEEVPLFLYTCNKKPSLSKGSSMDLDNSSPSSAFPVRDGLSMAPKAQNPPFHFEETRKLKRRMLNWKLVQNNDIISLIRRSKVM